MTTRISCLALHDWRDDISASDIFRLLEQHFGAVISGLEIGRSTFGSVSQRYLGAPSSSLISTCVADEYEWFGGVADRRDPQGKWDSYLLLRCGIKRELYFCSNDAAVSVDSIREFMCSMSKHGNLGYGYAFDSTRGNDVAYWLLGVTKGYPSTDMEKREADELSRWLAEKLPGKTAAKRYLDGMVRGVFPLNIINRNFVDKLHERSGMLRGLPAGMGEMIEMNNGSFLWTVPLSSLDDTKHKLSEWGLVL